ncbi:VWA domain-containing protein [Flammeovirgaceae bacterium SG7u.111]|nr:VWA domain-containing protein [Flammeovirgaceae bacterium SG7u.132]WPO36735.1 VWA domain-containing protein [Flammeovirgaceae bacterium SG7u.111]
MDFVFYRNIGFIDVALIALFVLLYAVFIIRTYRVARKVKSRAGGLLSKLIIRSLYFFLMIFCLLGPSIGESRKEVKTIGKDIYVLMDLSLSMDADDVQPSRLEKAKFELKNLVNAFSSDRVGLIIFSSDAFLQCPLTYDQNALMVFIETMNTGLVSSSGTDFSPALDIALKKHIKSDEESVTQQQSKIVILVSDGEDFGDETISIAKEIKEKGIRLFALGIGTKKGSKIPQGYRFKRNKEGEDVVTTLNDASLKKLTSLTGGKYFEVSDKKNDVPKMIAAIDDIEGEFRNARQVDASANRYYYFLIAALVLIVLDLLITVKIVKI